MKKIMFNDKFGLTKAVLEGRKTQTRRIVPDSAIKKAREYQKEYYNATLETINLATALNQLYFVEKALKLPYTTGEVVAIAQNYKDCHADAYYYKNTPGWTNKMFVKANLMLHYMRITGIRIERLQEISDKDCLKEGIYEVNQGRYKLNGLNYISDSPRMVYEELIDKIIRRGTWCSNPFVFIYDFELIK